MKNDKTGSIDMINGPIFKSLIMFAIPVMISNIFQMLYNTMDVAIVGHVLGEESLSAIGACSTIYEVLVGFALGTGRGLAIVTARCYGERNIERLKQSVAGALIVGGATSISLTVIGRLALRSVMRLLNTPEEIFEESYSYVSLIILWIIVMFAYNLFSGLLQALGNSFMPLVFLVISSLTNIFLDYMFIARFKMGVQGAAVATVIAQGISAVLCFIYILKKEPVLIPKRKHFNIPKQMYIEIATQGYALAFMSSVVSLGSVILQSGINGLGAMVIAGHTAARKIMPFYNLPFNSVGMAMTTFCSQNRGANRGDRIIKAYRYVLTYCAVMACVIGVIAFVSSGYLVRIITGSDNPTIIGNATTYLRVEGPFTFFLGIIFACRNGLQGLGEKRLPIISSVIELIGKILFVIFLIPVFGYTAVIFCEPSIWVVMAIQLLIALKSNKYLQRFRKTGQE
ncbi:MAG: MATE family efflux transporter [Lachnospiraceae bacterium]|nr:MATE family efflux transporter [Lachnospiraceae bacterium]